MSKQSEFWPVYDIYVQSCQNIRNTGYLLSFCYITRQKLRNVLRQVYPYFSDPVNKNIICLYATADVNNDEENSFSHYP